MDHNDDSNDTCFVCGAYKSCGLYHIVPHELGSRDIQQNMVLLCKDCHDLLPEAFDNLEKIMFSPDCLDNTDPGAKSETRLLCLALIKLIALWEKDPVEAHKKCKLLVDFWSSPERHKIPRNHGAFVSEFSECLKLNSRYILSETPSLHDVLTKIRELKKRHVSNNLIMATLKDIKIGNQDTKKKSKHHYDSDQINLLDSSD